MTADDDLDTVCTIVADVTEQADLMAELLHGVILRTMDDDDRDPLLIAEDHLRRAWAHLQSAHSLLPPRRST